MISKTPKITPDGPPTLTATDDYVWTQLAPRLLQPTKLAFIQLFLESGEPLSLGDLAKAAKIAKGHAEQHCRSMEAAGVLEASMLSTVQRGRGGTVLFLPPGRRPAKSSPSNLGDN